MCWSVRRCRRSQTWTFLVASWSDVPLNSLRRRFYFRAAGQRVGFVSCEGRSTHSINWEKPVPVCLRLVNQTHNSLCEQIHLVKRVWPRSTGDSVQNLNPSRRGIGLSVKLLEHSSANQHWHWLYDVCCGPGCSDRPVGRLTSNLLNNDNVINLF